MQTTKPILVSIESIEKNLTQVSPYIQRGGLKETIQQTKKCFLK